jgi:hypothetical protein
MTYIGSAPRLYAWGEDDLLTSSDPPAADDLDRLTHLVLVDGRLVDMWSEPVTGTRWQRHAERFDREAAPAFPPAPPPHELVLAWLDAAVGGRERVLALHTGPLVDCAFEPDPELPPARRELLATVVAILERAAAELRVPEARAALMSTLAAAWEVDHDAVFDVGSASRLAGGICWLTAKANGLLGPGGVTTHAALQQVVDCRSPLSTPGRAVRLVIAGYSPELPRPSPTLPDLLLVGRADLLTGATRRRLVRARDQALAAAEVVAAGRPDLTRG